ncbi:hypothetical protein Dsin_009560 [Dipteronia sinensis]|uniref:DUF4283 domain-containing protein n=1 Tax=Dipteronia sinensis TaxID=43782 RepID=A0AAE0EDL2_9ROSI|nr:hypothetical protein Dsin_009560 [Dipteronia sinensis]
MGKWSWSIRPHTRSVWVEIFGVPLGRWNAPFFSKVGRVLGDPLLIEDSTLQRRRLDRAKLLILMTSALHYPKEIEVKVGGKEFVVSVATKTTQVDHRWLERRLGLKSASHQSNLKTFPVMEKVGNQLNGDGQVVSLTTLVQPNKDKGGAREQIGNNDKLTDKIWVEESHLKNKYGREDNRRWSVESKHLMLTGKDSIGESTLEVARDKGKRVLLKRSKVRPHSSFVCNAKIDLDKRRADPPGGGSDGDESSSNAGQVMGFSYFRGECSKLDKGIRSNGEGSYSYLEMPFCLNLGNKPKETAVGVHSVLEDVEVGLNSGEEDGPSKSY